MEYISIKILERWTACKYLFGIFAQEYNDANNNLVYYVF